MILLIWFCYGEVCLIAVIRFDSNHMYMYIIHYVHVYHPLYTCVPSIIYVYIIHYVAFDLTGRQNYPAWSLFSPVEGGGQFEIRKWQQPLGYPHREHHGVLHRWLRQLQRSRNLSQRLWVRETRLIFSYLCCGITPTTEIKNIYYGIIICRGLGLADFVGLTRLQIYILKHIIK